MTHPAEKDAARRPIWVRSGRVCTHPVANYSCIPCAKCLASEPEAGESLVRVGTPNKASLDTGGA